MKSRLVSMLWKFMLGFQIPIFAIKKLNNNNNSHKIIIKDTNSLLIDTNSGKLYYSGGKVEIARA